MTMLRKAKIADFKSRLSAYLKQVRQGGEVIVMDRHTPVARVIPFSSESAKLTVRSPLVPGGFGSFRFKTVPVGVDAVELLREDRADK